jgi:large subunit ribosomal protein L4
MEVETYNIKGERAEPAELPEKIFGIKWNPILVRQVYDSEMANKRHPWAHTKTRGEISGGGRKPWRQKGTGRARHGSTRSPIWVGGGVTHGPRNERDYSVKINKKMRRTALLSLISKKTKDGELVVLDAFNITQLKTKEAFLVFKNLRNKANIHNVGIKGGRSLIAFPAKNAVKRLINNLEYVSYIEPRNLNVAELLNNKYLVIDHAGIEELKKVFK